MIELAMKLAVYAVMAILIYIENKRTIEKNRGISFVLFASFLVISLILSYYPEEMYVWATVISWPFVANYTLNRLAKKNETIDPSAKNNKIIDIIEKISKHYQEILDHPEINEGEKKIARAFLKQLKLMKLGAEIA